MLPYMLDPTGYHYRPLRIPTEGGRLKGWDVYALQTGLDAFAASLALDGVFGHETEAAVITYQDRFELENDGIAGIATQTHLGRRLAKRATVKYDLPNGLIKGHLEHESGYVLGNHPPRYSDGSFDCGIAQRNTNFTPIQEGFNTPVSVEAMAQRESLQAARYAAAGLTRQRAWECGVAHWNSPRSADALAFGRIVISDQERQRITAYIDACTAYVVSWT